MKEAEVLGGAGGGKEGGGDLAGLGLEARAEGEDMDEDEAMEEI